MKKKLSPLEILELISLAGTAAGTLSVVLLSQHVGYAIGPGALSLVLGAANRKLYHSGENNSYELVQINQKLSADLASVREQIQGLPSSSDYNSLKHSVQSLSGTVGDLESQKPGQLSNVGVELNPIRHDIVQLRSQYGNLQDFLAELRSRMETLPPPEKFQTMENEIQQMEGKLAQLPSKFQKMSVQAGSADFAAVTAEIEALKAELETIATASDPNSLAPELQVLKRQVEALENTSDRLVVETQNLAEKEEVRSLVGALEELQQQQRELQEATNNDHSAVINLRDRLETLEEEINRIVEEMPGAVGSEELQKLQQRFLELQERFDLRMALYSVEVKDGQTIELTGVEDALAKIAGAVSEVKLEMDSRMDSIESLELKTIHAQLLDQQQTLTALQTEYQRLLASTSDGNRWVESLSESEYRQKIESLERTLANTTESIDRIESSLSTNGSGDREPVTTLDTDLSALVPEIEQIGFLKNTVSQLATNLENLEKQVQFALNGGTERSSDEFREELDALKENLNRLETSVKSGATSEETVAATADIDGLTKEIQQIGFLNQKIANLESAFANTTDTLDRLTASWNVKEPVAAESGAIERELLVFAQEITQIGILKTTVSQLATNLESLENQVQFAVNGGTETIAEELRQEIDALKESLDAIEKSVASGGTVPEETAAYIPELKILSQEIEQIGILKDTVYQLSGNVEILDQQVHALATGSPNSITDQLKEQIDALTAQVEELPEPQMSGDLIASYETVMLRLEQVETAYLDLEKLTKENQDLSSRNDAEITDQFCTFNAQLSNLHQDISGIGQKLTELEQGFEGISVSELEAIAGDVFALQAMVSDIVTRLEDDLGQTNYVREEVRELAAALSTLETKLSTAIGQLDDEFNQLQLQTTQLAAEQAESQAATSQIETIIGNSIDRQMGEISQLLQDVAPCDYELVFDRPAIQESLATAIENSNKRLTIVCPWLNRETMSGLLDKLEAFLERNGQLQIGWGHLADINDGEFPLLIHQQWQTEELTKRSQSYNALNDLEALRQKYPNQVEYKVLGTHENFLVSDNNLALISSHHFLSGGDDFPEREVAIQTSSMKIIHGLIDRFKDPVLQPGNADAYYNRGFERLEIGDYQGAMEDYARAVEINPDRTTSYNNLGLAKYHGGDVPGAIAHYTKAIELDPNQPVTYFNRAVAYYKIGNYRKSIVDYTQVIQRQDGIRISAENTDAYFQRAEAYRQLGEYESAIYDYSMAIRLAPNDPVAYNNRGLARYNHGDYLGSIKDYSEALNLNPDDAVAYSNRGVSRLKSGDYSGAVADFDRAIELKANYASAYQNRGLARCEMGDRTGAIADLEKAAELFALVGNLANRQQALDSIKRLGDRNQ